MKILKERKGMRTFLTEEGKVAKVADTPETHEELAQEYRFLKALQHTECVPKVYEWIPEKSTLFMEFVESTPITDKVKAVQRSIEFLCDLRDAHIVHGDMTNVNVKWRDNVPVVLDWGESTFPFTENIRKRPEPDMVHFLPHVISVTGDPDRSLQRWMAIREHIKYYLEWGYLLDLGCNTGFLCGLAKADGMWFRGVDKNSEAIIQATYYWDDWFGAFVEEDILDYIDIEKRQYEIISMFSTWAYIVQDYGRRKANSLLRRCMKNSEIFLFETQLYGDGPGPEFLKHKADVPHMLLELGASEAVEAVTVPVGGRDAERTVWAVRS